MKTGADKKKILFILPALTAGGAERVLITLMNHLDRERFEPIFLTVSDQGPMRGLIDSDIAFHSLHSQRVLFSLFKLYKKIKMLRPDAVISTMAHLNLTLLLLKPLFPCTPFIVREAITPSFILEEHQRLASFLKLAYRWLYPKAAVVISPAQMIIDEFRDLLGMACTNHAVLYNPVDLKRVRAQDRQVFDVSPAREKTVYFVAAGRLHPQKGFDRLIETLSRCELPQPWHLTILGEGEQRPVLEALIKEKGLGEMITLAGHQRAPWPYIAQADCFVMPSRWEGLPNVVLESLACGTPVIATAQSGGIAEIAAQAPKDVIVVKDMDQLVQAMKKVSPQPIKGYRASLLPQAFNLDAVCTRFIGIIERAQNH